MTQDTNLESRVARLEVLTGRLVEIVATLVAGVAEDEHGVGPDGQGPERIRVAVAARLHALADQAVTS